MTLSYTLAGALAGGSGLRVLGPDNLGRVALTRAGTATVTTAAANVEPVAADTPRFTGSARRLVVEGPGGNFIRNPRAEGATAGTLGSGGVLPTYWSRSGSTTPLSVEVVGTGTESGIPYIDVRFASSGTTGGNAVELVMETNTLAPTGESVAFSAYMRLLSGTVPTGSDQAGLVMAEYNGSGSYLRLTRTRMAITSAPLASQRFQATYTMGDNTQFARPLYRFHPGIGEVFDFVLRLGAPQMEREARCSTLMLPPAGMPGIASRSADIPIWTPAGGFGGQGTVVVKAMLPQMAPFGASQGLWQIDDGTDQNRLQLRNTSAGSSITGVVEVGGTTLATLSGGNMAAGTPFRAAFTWAAGDQALCLNGGTVQTASASLPTGLARMLVGHASTQFNRAAYGEIELVEYRPTRIPNSLLQALANAA
jgi:hypothetical protein